MISFGHGESKKAKRDYGCIYVAVKFSATVKVAGETLGSSLCIYSKGMHEVQRLTSTALRDFYSVFQGLLGQCILKDVAE